MLPQTRPRRFQVIGLLVLLLAAPLPGALSMVGAAAASGGDDEAPRVSAYAFSNLTVPKNGSVVLSFDIEDATGVESVGFTLARNGSSHYVHASTYLQGAPSGRYNLTVRWGPYDLAGEWGVASIFTSDPLGNAANRHEPDIPTGSRVTYGDPSQPQDLDAPVVRSIAFPSAVPRGGNMTVALVIADETPLREVFLHLRRDGGSQDAMGGRASHDGIGFPPGNVTFDVTWPANAIPGNYSVWYVFTMDMSGNSRHWMAEELPNGSRTVTYGNLSEPVDDDAPVLVNHTFSPGPYAEGDDLVITFETADESNVTRGGFGFEPAAFGAPWLWVPFHPAAPVAPGVHNATYAITDEVPAGEYRLAYVNLVDEWDNEVYLYPPFAGSTRFSVVDEDAPGPRPDLVPVQANFTPALVRDGDAVTVRALVRNNGTASASNASVDLFVDGSRVSTAHVAGLAANASAYVNLSWTATEGNHTFLIRVDGEDRIAESDETNNDLTFVRGIWPAQRPDLVANLTLANKTVYEGDRAPMHLTVVNGGDAASAATTLRLYVDDVAIAERTVPALSPGGRHTTQFNWSANGTGARAVTLVADPDGRVVERNETNNKHTATLTVLPRSVVDLGVDIVDIRRPALETDFGSPGTSPLARRTIVLDLWNAGPMTAANATLTLVAVGVNPLNVPLERPIDTRAITLAPGALDTLELIWNPTGFAGDVDIVARITLPNGIELDASDNKDTHRDYVIVGGLDIGA